MLFNLQRLNRLFKSNKGKAFTFSVLSFLYSQLLGVSDLGFRTTSIELKLSQKYPPAIALEVLNSTPPHQNEKISSESFEVIQLHAEFPDLGLISLDELNFTLITTKPGPTNDNPILNFQNSSVHRSLASGKEKPVTTVPEDYFTEEEKLRLKMAHLNNDLDIGEFKTEEDLSFKDRIRQIIAQQGLAEKGVTNDTSSFNSDLTSNLKKSNASNTTTQQWSKKPNDPKTPEDLIKKDPQNSNVNNSSNSISILGDIEFSRDASSDLALTDQHFIDVRRFEEGIPKEVAQVDLIKGTFSMNLHSTKGTIIGRLTNKSGGIDGEGSISVLDLVKSSNPKLILKKIRPNTFKVTSAYGNSGWDTSSSKSENESKNRSHFSPSIILAGVTSNIDSDKIPINSSTTKSTANTKLFNTNFEKDSEFVVEAKAEFHRPTISISNTSINSEIPLLPDRMINGLSEILSEQDISLNLNRGDSLIWGIIKDKGRPVEGATISASQGARTSYYGSLYLPDQTRTKTSDNGMFSISLSNPGWNDLFVELTDGRHLHINTLVFSGKVSQVDVEVPDHTIPTTIRSFDAFTGEPLRTTVELQQIESPIDTGIEGTTIIDLPFTKNLSFVLVSPEVPYEKIRLSYTHLEDYLHIPLFTKNWIDSFKSTLKISDDLPTGNIVGFVQGDDFTVEVQNKESASKVAYFDQQGHFSNQGSAGGGFIVLNLEEDQVNLIILAQHKNKELVRIVRPEKEWTQVINAHFE